MRVRQAAVPSRLALMIAESSRLWEDGCRGLHKREQWNTMHGESAAKSCACLQRDKGWSIQGHAESQLASRFQGCHVFPSVHWFASRDDHCHAILLDIGARYQYFIRSRNATKVQNYSKTGCFGWKALGPKYAKTAFLSGYETGEPKELPRILRRWIIVVGKSFTPKSFSSDWYQCCYCWYRPGNDWPTSSIGLLDANSGE